MVAALEGNKARTKTMLAVIEAFMAAHGLPDVTVVADAGMVSEAHQKALGTAGLVLFTCGWAITAADEQAIALLPDDAWKPGLDQDGLPEQDQHSQ